LLYQWLSGLKMHERCKNCGKAKGCLITDFFYKFIKNSIFEKIFRNFMSQKIEILLDIPQGLCFIKYTDTQGKPAFVKMIKL